MKHRHRHIQDALFVALAVVGQTGNGKFITSLDSFRAGEGREDFFISTLRPHYRRLCPYLRGV
jgi:hypothetical protein